MTLIVSKYLDERIRVFNVSIYQYENHIKVQKFSFNDALFARVSQSANPLVNHIKTL